MMTLRQGTVTALLMALMMLPGLALAGFEYDEDSFNKEPEGPPEELMPKKALPAAPPKNSMAFCEDGVQKYMYYDFRTSESWCITKQEAFRRYIPSNAYKGVCCKMRKSIPSSDPTTAPGDTGASTPKTEAK